KTHRNCRWLGPRRDQIPLRECLWTIRCSPLRSVQPLTQKACVSCESHPFSLFRASAFCRAATLGPTTLLSLVSGSLHDPSTQNLIERHSSSRILQPCSR